MAKRSSRRVHLAWQRCRSYSRNDAWSNIDWLHAGYGKLFKTVVIYMRVGAEIGAGPCALPNPARFANIIVAVLDASIAHAGDPAAANVADNAWMLEEMVGATGKCKINGL